MKRAKTILHPFEQELKLWCGPRNSPILKGDDGRCGTYSDCFGIDIADDLEGIELLGAIVHESTHCVEMLEEAVGELGRETRAYLTEYIVKWIISKIGPKVG